MLRKAVEIRATTRHLLVVCFLLGLPTISSADQVSQRETLREHLTGSNLQEEQGDPRELAPVAGQFDSGGASVADEIVSQDDGEFWIEGPETVNGCDMPCRDSGCLLCEAIPRRSTERFWANAEYLYWHMLGGEIPALITTNEAEILQEDAGVLGEESTQVLLGNSRFLNDGQSGVRISAGFWLDRCQLYGVEFLYTRIGEFSTSDRYSSDDDAILARPFFNVDLNAQDARLVAFPDTFEGAIAVNGSASYDVYEVLFRRAVSFDALTPTQIVYGYRSSNLDDRLSITDTSTSISGTTIGTTVATFDRFEAKNTFHGFEAGILTSLRLDRCWWLDIGGKVAFGETQHTVRIQGRSISTNAQGESFERSGGLLTQESNIGTYESNAHGTIQDLSLRIRRQMGRSFSWSLGYSIHRWTDIARAGEQVDLFVNPTQIAPGTLVGQERPEYLGVTSNFVAQGITVGLEAVW